MTLLPRLSLLAAEMTLLPLLSLLIAIELISARGCHSSYECRLAGGIWNIKETNVVCCYNPRNLEACECRKQKDCNYTIEQYIEYATIKSNFMAREYEAFQGCVWGMRYHKQQIGELSQFKQMLGECMKMKDGYYAR